MKIFWDTNLFIYLWEKKSFAKEMAVLTKFMESGRHSLATSTLTLGEILVHPMRQGPSKLIVEYGNAMQQLALIPFDQEAAVGFARLRAANPGLRPPDAIQLACAVAGGCDLFLTNDNRLAGVMNELLVESLGDWCRKQG